ncbi:hypothetical protein LTR56_002986 [Elasticomyces elasticus]|nr:hypothetical protein LTR22_014709 [Elasticomyces elasticus]KAK3656638.1 hypothetical protein LTR56_002986 [Elasticomyces elasticus]KAK4930770.1 hypothetical protein LTR49_002858 [Elasticomyces elasticus]KAK5755602.1 hypothetical protein LTS12_014261 [Elasticomyces elasticus]
MSRSPSHRAQRIHWYPWESSDRDPLSDYIAKATQQIPIERPKLDVTKRKVRLLTPQPGHGPLLKYAYNIISLDEPIEYCALSYVWGDEPPMKPILVDSQLFWIRQNLCDFLAQAYSEEADLSAGIFIDAICIDQSSTDERSTQVKLMWEIYSRANVVITWFSLQSDWVPELIRQHDDMAEMLLFRYSSDFNRESPP